MQQLGHTRQTGRHAAPTWVYTLGLQTSPTLSKTCLLQARKVKKTWDSAFPPSDHCGTLQPNAGRHPFKRGENTEQVDSWLSKRKNAFNKQCRTQSRYFLTVSFNVCLLDWISPLIIAKTTFHRINVSSWFINGGRRTLSFYSSRAVPGFSPFSRKSGLSW